MTKVLLDADLDWSPLLGKQIGIIGYGSQGRAQALNLRDSGFSPLIGVRRGKSFDRAAADGFKVLPVEEVARASDVVMLLTPDETHRDVCTASIFPRSRAGVFLGFATGFGVHFGLVSPPEGVRCFLAAPKGPGHVLRRRFETGGGIPALVASSGEDRDALLVARAYAKAIGCGRVGVIETSFREEAVADLFGEQCVLSGGMIELMRAAFEVLVKRGFAPEVAYIECVSEVEYMASLISRVGLAELGNHISSTAFYGGRTRGSRIIDDRTKAALESILDEIEDGSFVREFEDYAASGKRLPALPGASVLEKARSRLSTP